VGTQRPQPKCGGVPDAEARHKNRQAPATAFVRDENCVLRKCGRNDERVFDIAESIVHETLHDRVDLIVAQSCVAQT
jgi:hypothetical protein